VSGSVIYAPILPEFLSMSDRPLVVVLAYDGLCAFEYGCAMEVFALSRPEAGPD
jgi:AraC family transcriptional activator FtrA